jgi:tetratricopeptide (TPR) repeat protein
MPRLRVLLLAWLGVLVVATATYAQSRGQSNSDSQWNNEALFDATTTPEELMDMARAAVSMSQYPLAEVYYQELLLRDPENVDAMCELAALYRRTGKLEYARGLLIRAGNLVPGRTDIPEKQRQVEQELRASLAREVYALIAKSKFEKALPKLSLLLTIDPDNARLYAAKARCLAALGETDAAISSIDYALAKDPKQEYHRLRDAIQAQDEKRKIKELESSAQRLLESNEWMREEAAEVLQAILAKDPTNQWARDQFSALSEEPEPTPPPPPAPVSHQLLDAVREVLPGVVRWLGRHVAAILVVLAVVIVFRSPLSRALAKRVHDASPLSGDLATINVAEALRLVNASALTGVLVFRTPEGTARVYFESGDPVHCEAFGQDGADALTYLVKSIEEGTFEMKYTKIKGTRSIDQPLDLILAGPPTEQERGAAAQRNRARREAGRKKSRMAEVLEESKRDR